MASGLRNVNFNQEGYLVFNLTSFLGEVFPQISFTAKSLNPRLEPISFL
jgi:hypothetical protein